MRYKAAKWLMGPILAAVLLPFALASGVGAASATSVRAYGPTACAANITIVPNPVVAGATVTVTITGTCDNDTFTIVLNDPITLGTITTNASGYGTGTFLIPADTAAGTGSIEVADASGNSAAATVTVTGVTTAVTTTPTTAPLAFTGTDAVATSALGAGALCLGGLLVLSSRKRRRNNLV